jgi:hypothetical protein
MANITNTGFVTDVTGPLVDSDDFTAANDLGGAALYVGTGGDVAVVMSGVLDISGGSTNLSSNDVDVIFKNVPSGTFLPIAVDFLCDTGTTASNILKIG